MTYPDHLESLVGRRLFAWLGSLALLLATGWFVKHAIDNAWLSPSARLLGGAALGAALVAAAHLPRFARLDAFAQVLAGAGLSILYLCDYYACAREQLLGPGVGFAAAVITTLLGLGLALRRSWPSMGALALLGGYLSPIILPGDPRPHLLFPYLALLLILALGCSLRRGWGPLQVLALAGTAVHGVAWYLTSYEPAYLGVAAGYLALFDGLFLALPTAASLSRRRPLPRVAIGILAAATASCLGGWFALLYADHRIALGWVVLARSGLALGLFGVWTRRVPADRDGRDGLLIMGIALAILAVPLHLELLAVPVAWALQALLLAAVWARSGSGICSTASVATAVLSAAALLYHLPLHTAPFTLALNRTFASWAVVIGALGGCSQLWRRAGSEELTGLGRSLALCLAGILLHLEVASYFELTPGLPGQRDGALVVLWSALALVLSHRPRNAAAAVIAGGIAFACFAASFGQYAGVDAPLLLHGSFALRLACPVGLAGAATLLRRGGRGGAATALELAANLAWATLAAVEVTRWTRSSDPELGLGLVSGLWGVQALLLIVSGLQADLRSRRLLGFALFALVLLKVVLVDTETLDPIHRVLSWAATGLLLLAGSYLYHARAASAAESERPRRTAAAPAPPQAHERAG